MFSDGVNRFPRRKGSQAIQGTNAGQGTGNRSSSADSRHLPRRLLARSRRPAWRARGRVFLRACASTGVGSRLAGRRETSNGCDRSVDWQNGVVVHWNPQDELAHRIKIADQRLRVVEERVGKFLEFGHGGCICGRLSMHLLFRLALWGTSTPVAPLRCVLWRSCNAIVQPLVSDIFIANRYFI